MLHNSGGVVTAYSWLQRVMKHQRPPPDTIDLQGPLRYIISNVSEVRLYDWMAHPKLPYTVIHRDLNLDLYQHFDAPILTRIG